MTRYTIFITLLTLTFCLPAAASETLSYAPTKVQLSGTITVQRAFGPPNFGENPKTDAMIDIVILDLDVPINVLSRKDPTPNIDSFYNLTRLQLVSDEAKPFAVCPGSHVTLLGELFEIQTGNDITGVGMGVSRIIPPQKNHLTITPACSKALVSF